jgi:Amt family ammonium transporter
MSQLTAKKVLPFLILTIIFIISVFISTNSLFNGSKIYSSSDLFGPQFIGMAILVTYSFTVSFLILKFINFNLPLRVSIADEEIGLYASQHDEKYLQGTLLVHKNGLEVEESLTK